MNGPPELHEPPQSQTLARNGLGGPRSRLLDRAGFSATAFAAMMSGYVQSPLGNSEHGENRRNESHTGDAEGRVE